MKTIKKHRLNRGVRELANRLEHLLSPRGEEAVRISRRDALLLRRAQAGFFRKFGVSGRDAHRISWFIYLVNGECNPAFLSAMETWVRELALATGSVQEVLDAVSILAVTRIDFDRVERCAAVRREVIRYVQGRFNPSAGMKAGDRVPIAA